MSELRSVEAVIPHREPMLFVTKVTALYNAADETIDPDHIDGDEVVGVDAYWELTGDEWFFSGHFPGNPMLPGFFGAEALAQAGCYAAKHRSRFKDDLLLLAGWDKGKPTMKVRPPARLDLHVDLKNVFRLSGWGVGEAYVEGELAVKSMFRFAVDLDERKKRHSGIENE